MIGFDQAGRRSRRLEVPEVLERPGSIFLLFCAVFLGSYGLFLTFGMCLLADLMLALGVAEGEAAAHLLAGAVPAI